MGSCSLRLVGTSLALFVLGLAASCKDDQSAAQGGADAKATPHLDCDRNPANGREVDPATDSNNCGSCGHVCKTGHGKSRCVEGRCALDCDRGWSACGKVDEGCNKETSSDPLACGACAHPCRGTPCRDSACVGYRVVARDVDWIPVVFDGSDVYFAPDLRPTYKRVHIADGKVSPVDAQKTPAPFAFDGKRLYGCKFSADRDGPCELMEREGDGPSKRVATLAGLVWGVAAADATSFYWVRKKRQVTMDGGETGIIADIVSTPLAGGETRVVAQDVASPHALLVDPAAGALYWAAMGDGVVRRSDLTGGQVRDVAKVDGPSSLALSSGGWLYIGAATGLWRVKASGEGAPERLVVGSPPAVGARAAGEEVQIVSVLNGNVYWSVMGRSAAQSTLLSSSAGPGG